MTVDTDNELPGQPADEQADPSVMVIFGASGDLTKRKLIPALYNLAKGNLLSREFAVIGIARSEMSNEQFRDKLTNDMKEYATSDLDPDIWEWLRRHFYYMSGEFTTEATYEKLKGLLEEVNKTHNTHGNYFYYLAT